MIPEIKIITTPFIFRISVNCCPLKTDSGFILVDTAQSGKRALVEKALAESGCTADNLKLIVLTHGDFDHCGNAAYLRAKFGTKVAMHPDDCGMVERGDMFWNRKSPNFLVRTLFDSFLGLSKSDRFTPDINLVENSTLSAFGLEARIVHLPGHSKGSIGILTPSGDLFCGDLLGNLNKPNLWSLIDDKTAAYGSVEKLRSLPVHMVYPGHGSPFLMQQFSDNFRQLAVSV